MSKYPALSQMGIQNPGEIDRYAVYAVEDADILRVVYARKKGSILPVSRKYRFERIKKSTMVDSGTRQTAVLFESSDAFKNAVSELESIVKAKRSSENLRALIDDELRTLEQDVASRTAYIRSLMEKL